MLPVGAVLTQWTGRDKDLTKAIGYALFETMVRRLKRNMASAEGAAKINCKLRRRTAVERSEHRAAELTAGSSKTCTILLPPT